MINEKVSVIVPVYNSEEFISETIESIQNQTYTNWELILVNDGSTDNSGMLCDEFSRQDPRITVLHIKNSGVASARNAGLDAATGTFIAFCDSDDFFEKDHLQTLLEMYRQTKADLCIGGIYVDSGNSSRVHPAPFTGLIQEDDLNITIESWFDIYWMGLWNKLFITSYIRQNRLGFIGDLSMGEDSLFTLHYLCYVKTVFCSDKPIYHYRQHGDSSLTRKFNKDRMKGQVLIIEELKSLAESKRFETESLEDLFLSKRSEALAGHVYTAFMDKRVNKTTRRAVFAELKRSYAERKELRSRHNLTNKIIGTASYPLLCLYFKILSVFR